MEIQKKLNISFASLFGCWSPPPLRMFNTIEWFLYLTAFEYSISDHVGILIDPTVPGVDAEQETAHPQEEEQDKCGFYSPP